MCNQKSFGFQQLQILQHSSFNTDDNDMIRTRVETMRSRFTQEDDDNNELQNSNVLNDNYTHLLQKQKDSWISLWNDNVTPWDLGKPTPALISELNTYYESILSTSSSTTSLVLVPGCGSGYDLVTLAYHFERLLQSYNNKGGDDPDEEDEIDNNCGNTRKAIIVGLDVSETPLSRAANYIMESIQRRQVGDNTRNRLNHTRIDLVQGDFFEPHATLRHSFGAKTNDLLLGSKTDYGTERSYDLIFDYTFLCALPPSLRKRWGERTARLLKPKHGRLLTFMFPIHPNPPKELKGPPYPVTIKDYQSALEPHGLHIMDGSPRSNPDSAPSRSEMELTCWWSNDGVVSKI